MIEAIAEELAQSGWSARAGFLDRSETRALADECHGLWTEGEFRHARVGIGASKELRPEIRTDHVLWLDDLRAHSARAAYFERLEALRLAINRRAYLGLFGFEAHFAVYPPGAFYRRHVDQFRGAKHRVVTCVLYLNDAWQPEHGGCLRLYLDDGTTNSTHDVMPVGGTLVVFRSATFEHEVLPATRDRMSVTGWFCTR